MIVCDGSNGAGKTTVIKAIAEHLQSLNREFIISREPGGTPVGEKIREVVLSPATPEMCDLTELLLFGAARAQHLQEKILPALVAGKVVICDRFVAATISFQHYARGIDLRLIEQINDLVLNGFQPDMNIILDLDPLVGMARVHQRGEGLDRMEDQQAEFLQRARNGYLMQAQQNPALFALVDASQPLADVVAQVLNIVDGLLVGKSQVSAE